MGEQQLLGGGEVGPHTGRGVGPHHVAAYLGDQDRPPVGKRMVLAHDGHERVGHERLGFGKPAEVHARQVRHQAHIAQTVAQVVERRARSDVVGGQRDVAALAPDVGLQRGEQGVAWRVALESLDSQRELWLRAKLPEMSQRQVVVLQDALGIVVEHPSRRGEHGAHVVAHEQLRTHALLQGGHVLAERGLRDVEHSRRTREAAFVGDRHELAYLVDGHGRNGVGRRGGHRSWRS